MRRSRVIFITLWLVPSAAFSVEGGLSNYIPGFYGDLALAVEPPKGVSLRNDLYYYSGDADGSVRSGQVEIEADIALAYNYTTVFINPDIELFGGSLAFGITPAFGYVDIDATVQAGPGSLSVKDDDWGLGDATFSANIFWNQDNWHFLWANYVVAPIGEYDEDELANPSLNYWTFETDIMVTYLDESKGRDFSVVVGYLYNTENDDTDYKSGDEFHIDYVLNQFITESFGLGVTGFYYRQLSGDSGDGAVLGNFKGEAWGIGPSAYYKATTTEKDIWLAFKWMHEFSVENRFDGDHIFASFALSF